MFEVDWMGAVPKDEWGAYSHVTNDFQSYDLHVLINWIRNVTIPMRLNGADATVCPNVASESTARNDFTQSIDVCAIRQSGSNLVTINQEPQQNEGRIPAGIDLRTRERSYRTPCWGQMH
jgi:hypothetical protein